MCKRCVCVYDLHFLLLSHPTDPTHNIIISDNIYIVFVGFVFYKNKRKEKHCKYYGCGNSSIVGPFDCADTIRILIKSNIKEGKVMFSNEYFWFIPNHFIFAYL